MWGKNHCSTHRVFELNMNFQMFLFFVRLYDISRFLRFRTICVIFSQFFFLHICVHGVYMKLDNISFSSPKIICVSRDITCGCPYDIHGIAHKMLLKWITLCLAKSSVNFFSKKIACNSTFKSFKNTHWQISRIMRVVIINNSTE